MDNPQEDFHAVHIAGTSGKTSTCYYIANMLEAAGYTVGLSASPHVTEMNERVQIGSAPLSEQEFCLEFNEFIKILNTLSITPTYFELFVAFTYWYFAKIKVDYAVIEVGIGGMFDATNVIKRPDKICVITDIDLDHTDILGNTVSEIAQQKAGIIQKGNVVFMHDQSSEVTRIIQERTNLKKATLYKATPAVEPMAGHLPLFQQRNWTLAKCVCEYIFEKAGNGLDTDKWQKTTDTIIPGRLEIIERGNKKIILDGAHNSQKMRALASSYKRLFPDADTAVLLAITETKDVHLAEIASQISKISTHIIISTFASDQDIPKKSIGPNTIAKYFNDKDVYLQPDLQKAFQELLDSKKDFLLITGSLYLISAIKKII